MQQQSLTPESIEVILVDNGSVDNGLRLAENILSAGRSPFEIIRLAHNGGPSYARNIGWRRARAPWIQFLDSDDLLLPEKLEHQLRFAANASSTTAVIYSEWQNYVFNGEWTPAPPVKDPNLDSDLIGNLLETDHFISTGSQIFRRAWLEHVGGFDENCWLIEDVHLSLRLAMAGGAFLRARAGRPLFYYRKRGHSSLSGSRRADFLNGCVRNYQLAENYWRQQGLLSEARARFLLSGYEGLLHNLIEADPAGFDSLLAHLRLLKPDWEPLYDRRIRLLSSMIGYRHAAQLAVLYRRCKTIVNKRRLK